MYCPDEDPEFPDAKTFKNGTQVQNALRKQAFL